MMVDTIKWTAKNITITTITTTTIAIDTTLEIVTTNKFTKTHTDVMMNIKKTFVIKCMLPMMTGTKCGTIINRKRFREKAVVEPL